MRRYSSLIVRVCCFLMLITATSAFAATVAVGTCQPGKVSFDNLDDAVNGVPDGSIILVCPGIYQEQIAINRSLTMKAVANGNTSYVSIVPPPGGLAGNAFGLFEPVSFFGGGTPFAAQVTIKNGANVTLNGITIDAQGPITTNCFPMVVGVLIQDASATLNGVVVKNQVQTGPGPFPCFFLGADGIGVLSQNDSSNPTTVNVLNSTFLNAAQGYESDGVNTTSTITNSTFSGTPLSDGNAINIFNGSSSVRGNTISNFNFPGVAPNDFNDAAYAMLLECNQSGTVANNTITNSQGGIILTFPGCPTTGVSITGNTITDANFIAIQVAETNGTIQGNDIRNSRTAIRLPDSVSGNAITGNRITGTCAALVSNPTVGFNLTSPNTISSALNLALTNTTGLCP